MSDLLSYPAALGLQVFYHLGELDSALTYALGAGSLFNVNDTSDYVQTLVGEHALLQ
jgi:26S proteasome regulatory subunit N2